MRCARHVAYVEEVIYVYTDLVENTEGKVPLGRHEHILDDNIKINFKVAECGQD